MKYTLSSIRSETEGDNDEVVAPGGEATDVDSPEETEASDEEVAAMLSSIAGPEVTWSSTTLTHFGPASRSIIISGEVDESVGICICSQLQALDVEDQETPIRVFINTPGGDVMNALAIYDMMRAVEAPIITVVQGRAYSAGMILMQGGDLRLALPHSKLFYHEPVASMHTSSMVGAADFMEEYEWSKDTMEGILRTRSKISKRVWKKQFESRSQGATFTAQEAKGLNLIDDIIEYSPKVELSLASD